MTLKEIIDRGNEQTDISIIRDWIIQNGQEEAVTDLLEQLLTAKSNELRYKQKEVHRRLAKVRKFKEREYDG